MLPDFSKLNGKQFVASSGATATITVLGPGGVSVRWHQGEPETAKDREEIERWMFAQCGIPREGTDVTRREGGKSDPNTRVTPEELNSYRTFLKKSKDT